MGSFDVQKNNDRRSDQLTMESIFLENVLSKAGFLITGDTREIDALSKFVGAQYSNDSGWSRNPKNQERVEQVRLNPFKPRHARLNEYKIAA